MSNAFSPQLVMLRPSLSGLPAVVMPEGYRLRHFRPGDEEGWNRLMDAVFERAPGSTDFDQQMRPDDAFQEERVWLVEKAGEIVATASAWHRPKFGPTRGYLHWVGTHPGHRGMKLGAMVSVAALQKIQEDGRDSAVLETDDFRIPAVMTYLKLEFEPLLVHENQRKRWKDVLDELRYPERFEAQLSGPLFEPQ